jgi:hypothetical protein
MEWGVVDDGMPCDRERRINSTKTLDTTIHSDNKQNKMAYLTILLFGKGLCQFWTVCKIWVQVIVTTNTVALILSIFVLWE